MRLGPVRSEQRRQPQDLSRVLGLAAFEIEQAKVEEQLPVVEAKLDRLLILGEFLAMLANDSIGKSQVIMRERVAGVVLDDDAMAFDRLGVIFHAEEIVSERIANLLVGRIVVGAGARADRQLENQCDQCHQVNTQTPKAEQFLNPPAARDTRREESDASRNFRYKKTRSVFCNAARKKGVVPVIAIRINPGSRDWPIAGGRANSAPPTLNGSICLGDSKQGGRLARSPCRTIRQTVTDWPEEPSPAMLPP